MGPFEYHAYGGPGGSAGYWSDDTEELVFFDMSPARAIDDDTLAVLYHEAFHQYVYYSIGQVAPHSWFNEGHGDYFAGFNYTGGSFVRGIFDWRIDDAKRGKKDPKRPPLKEWITWSQGQYYGSNKAGMDAGENYALGWSLVYFLRTTKKPEYQGILERYFKSLKASVTHGQVLCS